MPAHIFRQEMGLPCGLELCSSSGDPVRRHACVIVSASGNKRPCSPREPVFLGACPTTSILIRARSVVQVHPGPPFKSPVNTRLLSLFPFSGLPLKKPFCQPFVNFTIGRMASSSASLECCTVKLEQQFGQYPLCRQSGQSLPVLMASRMMGVL